MGSLDTVGERGGAAIATHVADCLRRDCAPAAPVVAGTPSPVHAAAAPGSKAAAPPPPLLAPGVLEAVLAPPVEPRDAEGSWWTRLERSDSQEALAARYRDLFMVLRHDAPAGRAAVVVGHSLFFRGLVAGHLGPGADERLGPALAEDLRSKKLDNGACLCLDLEWAVGPGSDPMAPPAIINASLVLGSRFKDKGHKHGSDGKGGVSGEKVDGNVIVGGASGVGAPEGGCQVKGWLMKESKWRRQWRHRHFKLDGKVLSFAESEGASSHGVVDLDHANISIKLIEDGTEKHEMYRFEIATPLETIRLGAASERERASWVAALRGISAATPVGSLK